MRKKIPNYQIIRALHLQGGMVTHAATALGITYHGLRKRLIKSKELQLVLDQIREDRLDLAEGKLMELVKSGNLGAICFYLKCQGKLRGWIERQEIAMDTSQELKDRLAEVADVIQRHRQIKKDRLQIVNKPPIINDRQNVEPLTIKGLREGDA